MGRRWRSGGYNIIYADPAWAYDDKNANGGRGAACKYPVMSPSEIATLPIRASLAADNCACFLWVTLPMLPFASQVLTTWGFKYKTCAFVWVKLRKAYNSMPRNLWEFGFEQDTFFGTGHWTRANAELCLLGTHGRPKRVSASVRQVVFHPVMAHSAKPPQVRDRIVELCGDVPRIELFARDRAPGWDATGLELDGMDVRDFLVERWK